MEEKEGRLRDNLCESGIRKLAHPTKVSSRTCFLHLPTYPAQPSGSSQPKPFPIPLESFKNLLAVARILTHDKLVDTHSMTLSLVLYDTLDPSHMTPWG